MFLFLISATSYHEPESFQDTQIAAFSQIGPPLNLSLYITEENEYILSWEQPDYGLDQLRYYILQWWQEPEHVLYGKIETSNLTYTVRNLREDVIYSFQAFSLSTSDYRSGSNEITVLVPPYNRVRVSVIGAAVGVFCIIFAGVALWYARSNWRRL